MNTIKEDEHFLGKPTEIHSVQIIESDHFSENVYNLDTHKINLASSAIDSKDQRINCSNIFQGQSSPADDFKNVKEHQESSINWSQVINFDENYQCSSYQISSVSSDLIAHEKEHQNVITSRDQYFNFEKNNPGPSHQVSPVLLNQRRDFTREDFATRVDYSDFDKDELELVTTSQEFSSLSISDSPDLNEATSENPENHQLKEKDKINKSKNLTRKRRINTNSWIDSKAKKARNSGKGGIGRKGKVILPRELKPTCGEKCRFRCASKITLEERQEIFAQFWSIGDKAREWVYLSQFIKTSTPKRTVVDQSDSESDSKEKTKVPRKNIVHEFLLPANGENIKVCKTMFLNTFDISHRWIRTIDQKRKISNDLFVAEEDLRGKHKVKHNKIPDEVKETAIKHINSFPHVESHYCRQTTQRKYLDENLSVAKMYRLYKVHMIESNQKQIVSQQMYSRLFNTKFNLAFFKPKKDRCASCEGFSNLTDDQRDDQTIFNQKQHLSNKNDVRNMMKEDQEKSKSDNTFCSAVYDLQNVLATPKADIGLLYYLMKVSIYNFTIYRMGHHTGHCYIWNETVARRGSNEIGSMIYKFIQKQHEAGVQEFSFYSDNCPGQNKNKNILSMYVRASKEFQISITHRYLEAGHTQNPGDSMHSTIESECRNRDMFTQNDWVTAIENAKVTGTPYTVYQVSQDDVINLADLAQHFNWAQVEVTKLRELQILPHMDEILIKLDNFSDPVKQVKILKKSSSWDKVVNQQIRKVDEKKIDLNHDKIKHIKKMLENNLIPKESQYFYYELIYPLN